MIKFGPSGLCQDFALSGKTRTMDAPEWLKEKGADCFEYSFGRGINLKTEMATEIANAFGDNNIEISVHAPYFINLATVEDLKASNNHRYIFDSLQMLSVFKGKRCVIHPGSPLKLARDEAITILMKRWEKVLQLKNELGYSDLILSPEVMGKKAQLGNLDEVCDMCAIGDDTIIPCVDFGHYNSRHNGVLRTKDDFRYIFDTISNRLGEHKVKNMHIHFSKIEYGDKGELRHLTFEDDIYGPDYQLMLQVIKEYNLTPYIICESAGTQTRDSIIMKTYYNSLK